MHKHKEEGWFRTRDEGGIILPSDFTTQLVRQIHQSIHLGERKIQNLLRRAYLKVFDLEAKTKEAVGQCPTRHLINAKSGLTRTGHGRAELGLAPIRRLTLQR